MFAMDLANDVKQIVNGKLLVQTKLELKQITSKAFLRQMNAASDEESSHVHQTYQMETGYVPGACSIHQETQLQEVTSQPVFVTLYSPNNWKSE